MEARKFKFLAAVLGNEGAKALRKAAERSVELENAIVPRAVIAWANLATRFEEFEGNIPGVEDTYLHFQKSEDGHFTGSVSIGDDLHAFDRAGLLHLVASVAVALGSDASVVSPRLKDQEIQRLGQTIDTLAKAKLATQELARLRKSEPLEKMAIAAIKPGQPMMGNQGGRGYDYSHVLTPEHRQAGYSLTVHHDPDTGGMEARLRHGRIQIGAVKAWHSAPSASVTIDDAEIVDGHQNKGLGPHMYESLMAHGLHHLGAKAVRGGVHSSMAHKVHEKLSARHGMDYTAGPGPGRGESGPYDGKFGSYNYAIKGEMDMEKAAGNMGQEAPGPAAAPKEPIAPEAPASPDPTQNSKGPTVGMRPKLPKLPKPGVATHPLDPQKTETQKLAVTKSQSRVKCAICDQPQFKADRFVGCVCLSDLAKSAKTEVTPNGYRIAFGSDWDRDSILVLVEALRETN